MLTVPSKQGFKLSQEQFHDYPGWRVQRQEPMYDLIRSYLSMFRHYFSTASWRKISKVDWLKILFHVIVKLVILRSMLLPKSDIFDRWSRTSTVSTFSIHVSRLSDVVRPWSNRESFECICRNNVKLIYLGAYQWENQKCQKNNSTKSRKRHMKQSSKRISDFTWLIRSRSFWRPVEFIFIFETN